MHTLTLLEAFSDLEDPRSSRGIRHPFTGIVTLALLGMLARIREMEVLVRWATANWQLLREPLGFDRDLPPCATTISRTLARCNAGDFQQAFSRWLKTFLSEHATAGVIAVDGKTCKQGLDEDGTPLHLINVFLHDLQTTLAQWSTGAEKTNEPTVLRNHLQELLEEYPFLQLITGDAIFAQRPLIDLMCEHDCDYLWQIKANQGDALDAIEHCFVDALEEPAAAETVDKKGGVLKLAACG